MNNLRKFINIFLIGSTAGMLCAHEKQILENEYVKAVLDPDGARIVEYINKNTGRNMALTIETHRQGIIDLGLFEDHNAAFPFGKKLRKTFWKVTGTTSDTVSYSQQPIPGIIFNKTFSLKKNESRISMEWKVSNNTNSIQAVIPWFRNATALGSNNFRGISNALESRAGLWHNASVKHHELGDTIEPVSNWCSRVYPQNGSLWFYADVIPQRYYNCYMNSIHTLEQIYPPLYIKPGESKSLNISLAIGGNMDYTTGGNTKYLMSVSPQKIKNAPGKYTFNLKLNGINDEVIKIHAVLKDTNGKTLAKSNEKTANIKVLKTTEITLDMTAENKFSNIPAILDVQITDAKGQRHNIANTITAGTLKADARFFPEKENPAVEKPQKHNGHLLKRTIDTEFYFVDSMESVTPSDTFDPKAPEKETQIDLARNEGESFMIAVRARNGNYPFRLQGICGKLPEGISVKIHPVDFSLQNGSTFGNSIAKTGRFANVIMEDTEYVNITGNELALFHVDINTGKNVKAGKYSTSITFKSYNNKDVKIPLVINVMNFTLNSIPSLKTDCGDLFGKVMPYAQQTGFQGTYQQLQKKARSLLLAHKLSPRYDPLGNDPALWEKEYAQALAEGASHFCISRNLLKQNPELLRQKGEFFAKKNALKSTYTYPPFDEITKKDEARFIEWNKQWRSTTKIPVMLTYYESGLYHMIPHVDVWVRGLENSDYTSAILKHGKELYLCNPRGLTEGVDVDPLLIRSVHWYLMQNGYSGTLLWATANWISPTWKRGKSSNDFNAQLMYPAKNKILPTVRLKVFRDGVEDFEYLHMLKQNLEILKKQNPAHPLIRKAQSMAQQNWNDSILNSPANLRLYRKKIADMIVKLQGAVK